MMSSYGRLSSVSLRRTISHSGHQSTWYSFIVNLGMNRTGESACLSLRNAARDHNRISHAMDHFLIGRTHSGQNTSQFGFFASDEIVRRQSRASSHPMDFSSQRIEILQVVLPTLMKFLQNIHRFWKRPKRGFDSRSPFALREVMAD